MPSTDAVCNDLNHNSFLPSRRSLASVCVRLGFSDRSMRVPRTTSLPRISQRIEVGRQHLPVDEVWLREILLDAKLLVMYVVICEDASIREADCLSQPLTICVVAKEELEWIPGQRKAAVVVDGL
jgi:hypothetical protein